MDLEDIEKRASSAYRELQEAWRFDHVIPNHDGEDSDNWEAFYYLIGDARNDRSEKLNLFCYGAGAMSARSVAWGLSATR